MYFLKMSPVYKRYEIDAQLPVVWGSHSQLAYKDIRSVFHALCPLKTAILWYRVPVLSLLFLCIHWSTLSHFILNFMKFNVMLAIAKTSCVFLIQSLRYVDTLHEDVGPRSVLQWFHFHLLRLRCEEPSMRKARHKSTNIG